MLAAGKDPGDPKRNGKERHGGADAPTAARQMAARRRMGLENGTLHRLQADLAGGS